ncbi:FAD-dependent oxidoreductase [Puniceibacterium sediminis]|uniref:2-polyprenyl-6-methoxyphenol hydroxylase n=1 Tax=Puniceibacterium sediminis TaxID=1608407 RepID=A0A238ZT38_9RHOB|nr:FAD-dependent oxidoreductase [Puniceibacterium sediminis]SNR86587.1 2-polyprenyl-6-methoxyphenol hydroxylase [Puniceibacterium sediminis]
MRPSYSPAPRAVVIGGSIAGLLTARVLSERYAQVLVLDRDHLPDRAVPRQCVPQEHHVHLLLQRGQDIMERLFPGLLHDLEKQGALVVDLTQDVKCHQAGAWKRRWPSGITARYCTRTLLEHQLRKRVQDLPNVVLADRTEAQPLFKDGCVTGVRLHSVGCPVTGEAEKTEDRIESAVLVVDATGRGSDISSQLEQAGLGQVPVEQIVTRLGYVSATFARPDRGASAASKDGSDDWKVLLYLPRLPAQKRMAVISPIEGERWMVTAGAWFGQEPDPTHEGLLAYLSSLSVPDLHNALLQATPLSAPRRYRMPGGQRRHFDQLRDWPKGFLAIGDCVCSINPLYSQGMSATALQVEAMAAIIAKGCDTARIQRRICEAVSLPWQQAAAVEEQFEGIGLPPGLRINLHRAYFEQLANRARHDRVLAMAVLRVNNLIADPATLMAPAIAARVFAPTLLRRVWMAREHPHV